MILAPIVLNHMERRGTFCRYPYLPLPTMLLLTALCLTFATPLCCAFFKQRAEMPVTSLEPELQVKWIPSTTLRIGIQNQIEYRFPEPIWKWIPRTNLGMDIQNQIGFEYPEPRWEWVLRTKLGVDIQNQVGNEYQRANIIEIEYPELSWVRVPKIKLSMSTQNQFGNAYPERT